MFFWFFEARNSPEDAPLSVWLQGGPGAPSIDQGLDVNGPCIVQEDSNSTVLNPWSWNNHVNMLYVDQPVQAGFSYGEATPSLYDMITGDITAGELSGSPNYTVREGVFSIQDASKAPVTTAAATEVVWEFIQAWMQEYVPPCQRYIKGELTMTTGLRSTGVRRSASGDNPSKSSSLVII